MGGVKNSAHTQGLAVDMPDATKMKELSPINICNATQELHRQMAVGDNFLHIDSKPRL